MVRKYCELISCKSFSLSVDSVTIEDWNKVMSVNSEY